MEAAKQIAEEKVTKTLGKDFNRYNYRLILWELLRNNAESVQLSDVVQAEIQGVSASMHGAFLHSSIQAARMLAVSEEARIMRKVVGVTSISHIREYMRAPVYVKNMFQYEKRWAHY